MYLYKRCRCPKRPRCEHHYHYTFKLKGQRFPGCTSTANRALAERIAEQHREDKLKELEGFQTLKPILLSEHVKAYVAHTEKKNRSSYKDQAVLDRFIKTAGDNLTTFYTAFHIEKWMRERADEVSKSTVNRELNIVRGCFSRAMEWGRIAKSPVDSVKPYRVDDQRTRVCSPDEIKKLLDGAPADLALLARLTMECLLRLSEALNLRREDINSDYALIPRTKNGKSRKVPLTPELRAALLARCHTSGYVFGRADRKGKPPTQASTSVAFTRLSRKLNLDGISHHTFRHTGASVMIANGVSLRAVQEIGGWNSLRMVERYAHPTDAEKMRAVRLTHQHTEAAANGTTAGTTRAVASGEKPDTSSGVNS